MALSETGPKKRAFLDKVGKLFGGGDDGGGIPAFDPEKYGAKDKDEEESKLSAPMAPRLASYAHGYSYSQGKYPGGRPMYTDGAEVLPANLAPWRVAELQRALVDAGILKKPRWGVWDEDSQNSYKTILAEANHAGVDAQTILARYAYAAQIGGAGGSSSDAEGGGGGAGGGHWEMGPDGEPIFVGDTFVPPPLELRTSNKDDLRKVFRQAVIDMLGEGWSQQQINELVDAYNWKEIALQTEAYDQDVKRDEAAFYGQADPFTGKHVLTNEQPGGSLDIASPETFLEEEVRKRDPGGVQAADIGEVGGYADVFFNALGGYGGGG